MIVGNIVSQTKINVSEDFNVVKSLDEIIQGLPTLVIGWDYVSKTFPDANVLSKKISDDIYFTFKKNEKRDAHEEDIYIFTHKCYESLIKDISYVFIDPIIFKLKKIKKILRKLQSIPNPIAYHHKDMIYIYGENIIFGVDLTQLDFVNVSQKKVISKITKKSQVFLTENNIFIEYKNRIEMLDNQVKYIPYLYSIEHG